MGMAWGSGLRVGWAAKGGEGTVGRSVGRERLFSNLLFLVRFSFFLHILEKYCIYKFFKKLMGKVYFTPFNNLLYPLNPLSKI
jgi:hypothetical protein